MDNAILTCFFPFHFLFPFIVAAATIIHIVSIYQTGSIDTLGIVRNIENVPFRPYFTYKDITESMILLAAHIKIT